MHVQTILYADRRASFAAVLHNAIQHAIVRRRPGVVREYGIREAEETVLYRAVVNAVHIPLCGLRCAKRLRALVAQIVGGLVELTLVAKVWR
jgi:hypothetical protein